MVRLTTLEQALGVRFKDPSLLEQALVHSSYVNENPATAASNERLEFLGDAILGLIFAERLFRELPDSSEGEMTRLRAALVRRTSLASRARSIGLGGYLYLGKGEAAGGGCDKPVNLAGALEAVIAAIFLDQGKDTTRDFVLRLFDAELKELASRGAGVDYKTQLQHRYQAEQHETPVYHIVEACGPEHDRRFTAEVRVGDTVLGRGSGKSKRLAETEAARSALEKLKSNFTH